MLPDLCHHSAEIFLFMFLSCDELPLMLQNIMLSFAQNSQVYSVFCRNDRLLHCLLTKGKLRGTALSNCFLYLVKCWTVSHTRFQQCCSSVAAKTRRPSDSKAELLAGSAGQELVFLIVCILVSHEASG